MGLSDTFYAGSGMNYANLKLESVDDAGGFTAIASTDSLDADNEKLAVGCFNPLPESIPLLVGHKWADLPIGRARPWYDGSGKLMVQATLASTQRAQEVRELARGGMVDSVSVGFLDAERKMVDGVPHVTKGTLKELSVVTFGANPDARLVSVRGMTSNRQGARLLAAKAQILALEADVAALPKIPTPAADADLARAYSTLVDVTAFLTDLDRRR